MARDWRTAGLAAPDAALASYAERLTRDPASCHSDPSSLRSLRDNGFSDRAINDAVQICAYFNYINRVADGLGLEPEPWIDELGRVRPS